MKKNKEALQKTTSCGAIAWRIADDSHLEILLIKQFANKDSWGIPKGHVDAAETLEGCAMREVLEETGVTVSLGDRLPDCFVTAGNENKTVVSFMATPVGDHEPKLNDPDCEVADARWFDLARLPTIVTYQRDLVAHAVARVRQEVLIRDEDFYVLDVPEDPGLVFNVADVEYFQKKLYASLGITREYLIESGSA